MNKIAEVCLSPLPAKNLPHKLRGTLNIGTITSTGTQVEVLFYPASGLAPKRYAITTGGSGEVNITITEADSHWFTMNEDYYTVVVLKNGLPQDITSNSQTANSAELVLDLNCGAESPFILEMLEKASCNCTSPCSC